ncbi:hypothetical protein ACERK3_12970 [Phycisphaerales bacterium AB-hyl4]|uniref:Uncharacterized protein n=1 Tax=Natronomicrosphaera hydrolytica TaxID=3242702 RepID=A0ABV4U7B8_9BACT
MSNPDRQAAADFDLKCTNCAYDLRGLPTEGTCPECGRTIAESFLTRGAMTRHQLALLACRILALWVLVPFTLHLAQLGTQLYWIYDFTGGGTAMYFALIGTSLPILVNLGLAAFLWFLAPWLTRRIFAVDGPVRIGGPAAVWDFLLFVPLAVGDIFITLGVRAGIAFLTATYFAVSTPGTEGWQGIEAGSYLLVGLLLLLGGPGIVRVIRWIRTAGTT